MHTVELTAGTIEYDAYGPAEGRSVVFVHGYAMGASLWRPLAQRLAEHNLRCFAPTWPLGGHRRAMRPAAAVPMAITVSPIPAPEIRMQRRKEHPRQHRLLLAGIWKALALRPAHRPAADAAATKPQTLQSFLERRGIPASFFGLKLAPIIF